MTAIKNNNTIIIRNTERQSENVFFNKIVIAFENNRNILIKNKIKADISVGLSLGEYSALIYSEKLKFEDGIQLLKQRGYLMQHKLPEGAYSMLAIIGLESTKIENICNEKY